MQTTAEKRRAKLDRAALLSLRAALCPGSGREKLCLSSEQRQRRAKLDAGKTLEFVGLVKRPNQPITRRYKMRIHGSLAADECRAVQPAELEPQADLLWTDLTPHQRRALRKYRAGKKKERELAMALRQMKSEGCINAATENLNLAIKAGDQPAIRYWRRRRDEFKGH